MTTPEAIGESEVEQVAFLDPPLRGVSGEIQRDAFANRQFFREARCGKAGRPVRIGMINGVNQREVTIPAEP
jgi:hypothetical protein